MLALFALFIQLFALGLGVFACGFAAYYFGVRIFGAVFGSILALGCGLFALICLVDAFPIEDMDNTATTLWAVFVSIGLAYSVSKFKRR